MVFPETLDPGEAMAIAMNNIVLSDPDGQDPDMTGRGQNLEADNLGIGGGVESSNTFDLKDTSKEEVIEGFHGFEQQEIQASVRRGEIHQSVVDSETWGLITTTIDEEKGTEAESVTESHAVVGEKSKKQVSEPPKIGEGSRTRVKVYLLNDYPTEVINSTKLPLGRQVMLNFFFNLLEDSDRNKHSNPHTVATKTSYTQAAKVTCLKVKEVYRWHLCSKVIDGDTDGGGKVIINDNKIVDKIVGLYITWKDLERKYRRPDHLGSKAFQDKVSDFQANMEQPFYVLKKDWKDTLKKSGIKEYLSDIQHISNQMQVPQIGAVGSLDTVQVKRDNRKSLEQKRSEAAKAKAEAESKALKKRQLEFEDASQVCSESGFNNNDTDFVPESQPPKRSKIDVMSRVSEVGLARGVSKSDQALIAAATANSLGVDLDLTNISVGSAQYHNKKALKQKAHQNRNDFDMSKDYSLHFDGTLLSESGSLEKFNRIGVVVKSIEENQTERILSIPKTSDGSGLGEATVVIESLKDSKLQSQIKSMSFDTTASNTSPTIGACQFVEKYIGNPILYCACRHHTCELSCRKQWGLVFGPTNDPGVGLFRKFKGDWPELERKIDYNSLTVLKLNSLPEWLQQEAKNVLSWALTEFSKNTWPRGDYKEMMELLIVFLGGSVENFKFRLPGADHHARWMSKIIYTFKICLLSGQYYLDAETQEKIWECARFQALIYVKYWYMSPIAAKAPLNDLEYYEKLLNWRFVSNQHSFELLSLFRKHMWYLTDRLIPLSLFDSSVSPEVVTEMEMGQGLWKSR